MRTDLATLLISVVCSSSFSLLLHFICFQAFGAIGAIFGGPVAWPLSEKFGRQASLMLSGIPALAGWLLIANAHDVNRFDTKGFLSMLLVGRLLTGFAVGWAIFGISVCE